MYLEQTRDLINIMKKGIIEILRRYYNLKKILISLILAASITASGVPVMAAQNPETTSVTFDQALADLFDNSMTITDSQIFQVANAMQNDFSKLDRSNAAGTDEIKGQIKSFEAAKAEYFLGQGSCSYDNGIRNEWDRENQYVKFGFSNGETITKLLPRVRVDEVTVSENAAAVKMYEWITVGYRDQNSSVQNASGTGYEYTLNLTKNGNNWTVASVSDTEQNYTDLEDEGVHISDHGVTVGEGSEESEDSLVGAAKDDSLVGASYPSADKVSWNYDISKAVEYANQYALERNKDYTWWGGRGGDCSNFVSQCLHAGGFPLTSTWYKDSVAWISQNDLRAYLKKIGAGKVIENPDDSDILVGNPVWYNWDGKGSSTNHVTICVGTNADGVPVIDSHTSNKYHYKWNYGYDNTTFMTMQINQSKGQSEQKTGDPVYRLYNISTGEHFYTSSSKEKKDLIKIGWRDEGIGWVSAADESGVPVYRLFNPNASDHHYTTNKAEVDMLVRVGWNYEGVVAYAEPKTDTPLYRLYNPNAVTGAHHYTTNEGEIAYLEKSGWKYEGISWYSNVIPKN